MQQGGIYNAALFGASQRKPRPARDKVSRMGGIMASSPELMQAAQPAPAPSMGAGPMPMAQPAPMVPVQPMLPTQVPPQQPAPQPQPQPMAQQPAPQPQPQPAPAMMQEGGPVDVSNIPVSAPLTKLQMGLVGMGMDLGSGIYEKLVGKYGSEEKAAQVAAGKQKAVEEAVKTDNDDNIATTVVDQAELPPTDEGKIEFARNVFGLEDVNDIDEINRRIAGVARAGARNADEYIQAILLGLGEVKKTATARAEAAAEAASDAAGGFLDTEQGKAALEVYLKRIENNENPAEVERLMNEQMGNNIGTRVRESIAGAGGAPSGTSTTPQQLMEQAREAIKNGAPKDKVAERLRSMGVDPGGL